MNILNRLNGAKWPLATIAGLSAATLALHFRDPHTPGSWGVCPTFALAGIYCPGCGGLRGMNDLTNFEIVSAFQSNAFLFILIPVAVVFLLMWTVKSFRSGTNTMPKFPSWSMPALIVVALGFAIVRNFPFASFLQPVI